MPQRELLKPDHLGDGVYVWDDGHALTLAVNHHNNRVIVLEPFVIKALIEYAKRAQLIK